MQSNYIPKIDSAVSAPNSCVLLCDLLNSCYNRSKVHILVGVRDGCMTNLCWSPVHSEQDCAEISV